MSKIATKILIGLILLGFVLTIPINPGDAYAGEHSTKSLIKKIQLKEEKHLTVKMDIGAGIIDLGRNRTGDILNAEVEYDPEEIRVDIDYDRHKDKGELYLESKSKKRKGIDIDTEDNYWFLEFSDRIPISFEIDVGACEAEFDRLSFDGGVGDFTLDFSGEFEHRAYVEIDIGLGSLTILVPKDAGVQIKSESSFLSSFSIDERDFNEVEDDLFESDNFGKSKKELIFDIEVGLGSVEVEYIDRFP